MATRPHDNLHSRMVAWLKVALPLLALALLSTLFLFSRAIDPEDAIPYANVDVADRLAEPRMVGAGFSGITEGGAAITLAAGEARPGADDQIVARDISLSVTFPKGGEIKVTAALADLQGQTSSATLSGGVLITDKAGYRISTDGLSLSSTGTLVQSLGPIRASGPLGSLSANNLTVTENKDITQKFEIVFKGQVTVLYQPPKDKP